MKNILIATVGTRDVQLMLTQEDYEAMKIFAPSRFENGRPTTFRFARQAGEWLLEHAEYHDRMIIPIIMPVIDKLTSEGNQPDYVLLVYTNQYESTPEFADMDTVHYADLIEQAINNAYPKIKTDVYEVGYGTDVVNMDELYRHFGSRHRDLLLLAPDEVKELYLLPQGGIDQINTALMLRLIEYYRSRVKLLQVKEDGTIQQRNFVKQFLVNLDKQKLKYLVSNFYYDSVFQLLNQKEYDETELGSLDLIKHLNNFCYYKVNLNLPRAVSSFDFIEKKYPDVAARLFEPGYVPRKNPFEPYTDLYISCKMAYHQHNYSLFMQRFYSLLENVWRYMIISTRELADLIKETNFGFILNKSHIWYVKIKNIINDSAEKPKLLNYKDYEQILDYYLKTEHKLQPRFVKLYKNRDFFMNNAKKWRNKSVHSMKAINENELNDIFRADGQNKMSVTDIFNLLDEVFEVKEFGMYGKFNIQIISLLD